MHIFDGTGFQITSADQPYLGVPLGSQDFITNYAQDRITQWVQGLSHLSFIAVTQPHVAYAVLVCGLLSKLNYYLWTTPNIHDLFCPLELAIRQKFLSTMIPHPSVIWSKSYLVFPYPMVASGFVILLHFRGEL